MFLLAKAKWEHYTLWECPQKKYKKSLKKIANSYIIPMSMRHPDWLNRGLILLLPDNDSMFMGTDHH